MRVRVPATTANLGAGFDVFGLALGLYNEVELEIGVGSGRPPVIEVVGEGQDRLPRDERNIAWQAAREVFKKAGRAMEGMRMRLVNRIPLARGLGSSAAARVGAVTAANAVCGGRLSREEMLEMVTRLEGHPDNAGPALYGGLVLSIMEGGRPRSVQLGVPKGLRAVVCVPAFEVRTDRARRALPRKVPLGDAVFNAGRTALLVEALSRRGEGAVRLDLLGTAMEDRLHQRYRRRLVPGMERAFRAARRAGAAGVALSGSGPTILALVRTGGLKAAPTRGRGREAAVGKGMAGVFGKRARWMSLPIVGEGARVVRCA